MTAHAPAYEHPADGTCKALGFLELRKGEDAGAAPGGGAPVFRITSEVLDRAKDRLIGAGAKVDNYLRNPVLLWNHDSWDPAIGTAKVYQDGTGQWLMEPTFDGIGERSKEVAAKVAAGTLRACSVRFRLLKYSYNEDGGLDVEEWELLEVSIVNIPCNPEAERVKNQDPQKENPTPPAPPPEETPKKALEQADIDAITAIIQAQIAPVLEQLGKVAEMCQQMMAEEPAEPPAEGEAAAEPKSLTHLFVR